jgi:hypothetical protein
MANQNTAVTHDDVNIEIAKTTMGVLLGTCDLRTKTKATNTTRVIRRSKATDPLRDFMELGESMAQS